MSTPHATSCSGWDASVGRRGLKLSPLLSREAPASRPAKVAGGGVVTKLAVKPASLPASRPATTQPVKLTQAKKAPENDGDLPHPREATVEVTP